MTDAITTEALYDDIGPAYEDVYADLPSQMASIQWLISSLSQSQIRRGKCLDIGCGTGRPVCLELAAAGHDVLGIDVSSTMVEAARKQVPQAEFQQIDVHDYTAPPATFDVITVYFSLITGFSQEEIRQTVRKIYDWLKPGGLFVFMTAANQGDNVQKRWMGRVMVKSSLPSQDMLEWIRKVGFEVVHCAADKWTPEKAVLLGLCKPEDVFEEEHQVVYAKKPPVL